MSHDWVLVETLGREPVVVAEGNQTKNFVPISVFLRRNPNLMAIQTAISETVHGGKGLTSLTAKSDRVIRTEVVQMSDGRTHGVHLWIGPPDMVPPERPVPGPLKWDPTNRVATDTVESLANSGLDPSTHATHGRAFAEDLPARALDPIETEVLAMIVKPEAGRMLCSTWDVTDYQGEPITVGFVARALLEEQEDGEDRLICRAMNWRSQREETAARTDLAQRILDGLARPGVHRALVDLSDWTLLRWLDSPCPFYDWRATKVGDPVVHPDDVPRMAAMTAEFEAGPTARVLLLRGRDGEFTPIHVTVNRIELEKDTFAGLLSLRLPTDEELAAALVGGNGDGEADGGSKAVSGKRKHKRRKGKRSKT